MNGSLKFVKIINNFVLKMLFIDRYFKYGTKLWYT